ncbi:hypothetical protein [Rhodoferax antarcticus]|uniref:Uncharacterized protein n=1 Tax=Rhodoferax antarcticus ANT.BR TaxID=1111071 RepID=A0A1Q8YCL6_9BURK|nr:hypothetical protein [Rhodoferax antarcticus]APW45736.1 hypothetical protein RA876_04450 [Rhodoferax antarcticus]MCW2310778.1 hypothetical protein [Rhodoferax antarcticus]OLP05801.1 hypothetical protein BLL52_2028 [Rhodoferax antarcticus ANT.BR]
MTAAPLTHHDILALVAPFTRSGRHVDLPACDRIQRRVVFKPLEHATGAPELSGLRELLELEKFGTSTYRLTRTLVLPSGMKARLQATGREPAELLRRVDAVAADQHFQTGEGFVVAHHDALLPDAQIPSLTSGVVQVGELTLTMTVSAVRSVSADVLLAAPPGQTLDIPHDLLAVLGWAWSPLTRTPQGWTGKYRLRGTPTQRTSRAERALQRVAMHLAQTLAAPPSHFHDQHLAARWRVVFRRAIPILTPIFLLITLLLMPKLTLDGRPGLWTLVYQLPTVLIAISFMTQDLARFEMPRWPHRASAVSWLQLRVAGVVPKVI